MKTLYWIDDSHDNQRLPLTAVKRQLEEGLGVVLKPDGPINNRAEFTELLLEMNPKSTSGVIMDYQLTKIGEKKQMAFGTTWATEIRAKYPSIPVVGISHCLEKDIPKFQLENFLAFFPRKQLTDPNPKIDDLRSLLKGHQDAYRAFEKQEQKSGVDVMIDLLSAPAGVIDWLRGAIPSPFRGNWDKETPHAAGRWIWHDLQGKPGFMLDELGLATHLGLNLNGLRRVCSKFDSARYRGAFASEGRPRWWASSIRHVFETRVGSGVVGPIANARDELLRSARIKLAERKPLLSRPYGRSDSHEIPDCVAYEPGEIDQDEFRVQALMEDTIVDERDANPPFGFQARRIFNSKNKK